MNRPGIRHPDMTEYKIETDLEILIAGRTLWCDYGSEFFFLQVHVKSYTLVYV